MSTEEAVARGQNLAFKALLLRVSNKLTSDNLKDLKHLLKDQIPTSKIETATQGTDLFQALSEKDFISQEKTGFLEQLMDLIDRQDLMRVVTEYEEKGALFSQKDKKLRSEVDLNPVTLRELAAEVGKDWKMLARHLGLPETDIQQIQHAHLFDLHEASYQAIVRWQDKQGTKATVASLRRALSDMKLLGVVHKYF